MSRRFAIIVLSLALWAPALHGQAKEPLAPADVLLTGPFNHPWPGLGAIGLSPDGKVLAATHSFNVNTRLCLWNAETGKPMRQLHVLASRLVFSPDSKTLYAGGRIHYRDTILSYRGFVSAFDVATGRGIKSVDAGLFALSPDGKFLAVASLDPTDAPPPKEEGPRRIPSRCIVKLVSTTTWKDVPETHEPVQAPTALAFSSDGKRLAVGTARGAIDLFDIPTRRKMRQLDSNRGRVFHLAFSPDDKTLAATHEVWPFHAETKPIVLWDLPTGKERRVIAGHTAPISGLRFIDDGKLLLSASEDGSIRTWDAETFKPGPVLAQNDWLVTDVAANNKLAAFAGSLERNPQRPRLIDLTTRKEVLPPSATDPMKLPFEPAAPFPDPYAYTGRRKAALPDGNFLETYGDEPNLRLVDGMTQKPVHTFILAPAAPGAPTRGVAGFAVTPDGKMVATCSSAADLADRVIRFWDIKTGKERGVWKLRPDFDHAFRYSPDGKTLAVVHWEGDVRLYDVESGKERQVLSFMGFPETIAHLTFSKDGRRLAAANREKTLTFVWELN